MKLSQAKAICDLNAQTLTKLFEKGYNGILVEEISNYEICEKYVRFDVRFKDDGSFGDDEPTGQVYVGYNLENEMDVDF